MAVYKLNSNKKKSDKKNIKKTVGFSLIGMASVIFLFMTGIVPVLQTFLLGVFGVFGFPLCFALIVIGLALVNNRKYVMGARYCICLCLTIFFLLCVLQLAIVGGKGGLSFGDYLAKNYLQKWTAGGILIGFFSTILLYLCTIYGAYVICVLGFVLSVALLLDGLNFLKREKKAKQPVSVQVLSKDNKKNVEKTVVSEAPTATVQKFSSQPPTNIVLDGNLKEAQEKESQKPLTARQILGLDKKRNTAYEHQEPKPKEKPKSLREMILTPPEIDLDNYFKDMRTKSEPAPTAEVANKQLDALKNGSVEPAQEFHEDEFKLQSTPVIHRTLPEVKSQELVDRADDILRSAILEEKSENPDIFESLDNSSGNGSSNLQSDRNGDIQSDRQLDRNLQSENMTKSFERNAFDRQTNERQNFDGNNLAEDAKEELEDVSEDPFDHFENEQPFDVHDRNDRNQSFSRDKNFEQNRESFRSSLQSKYDRNMTQEDRMVRDDFARNRETFNMRNGTYARENMPIAPEEEPQPREPYVYEKPPIDLITTQSVDLSTLNDDVAVKRVLLENTLETFGVPAKVSGVVVGPAVTRYELEMPQGISVHKIKNRADDIALSLAAEGSIRIEAPIPGKSVVGVEVANESIATVSLKDVLISSEFTDAKSPLTFALGKDLTGRTICCDMRKLTHLLIAGTTGSGKSVCLNSIILSICYKASPEDVKIMLVDPKRVEFASYEGLPHLIMPNIICDTQKAVNALAWAVNEMERRFDCLGRARVREISEYNQTADVLSGKVQKMPYLVIIVDELADLMMTGKKDVEEKICRLAQKARAAGIHLILATQRPSVDVITGLIKSNFPSRISFAVSSATDSFTILDRVGAEKLLGKGDMLYFPNGAKDPSRVQACFVTTNEINNIVDFVRDNNESIFDDEIANAINNPNKNKSDGPGYNDEMDELLPQALKICIECGQASVSMIRRKFAIGYPRAARIVDQMEAAGYISSADGAKGRTVYTTEEEFHDLFGDQYD